MIGPPTDVFGGLPEVLGPPTDVVGGPAEVLGPPIDVFGGTSDVLSPPFDVLGILPVEVDTPPVLDGSPDTVVVPDPGLLGVRVRV